jgi:hypothetical protein
MNPGRPTMCWGNIKRCSRDCEQNIQVTFVLSFAFFPYTSSPSHPISHLWFSSPNSSLLSNHNVYLQRLRHGPGGNQHSTSLQRTGRSTCRGDKFQTWTRKPPWHVRRNDWAEQAARQRVSRRVERDIRSTLRTVPRGWPMYRCCTRGYSLIFPRLFQRSLRWIFASL